MKTARSFLERHIGVLVIAACVGVILALLFSNAFLLALSSKIADSVRVEEEEKLVREILDAHIHMMAMEQSQISNWGKTLEAVEGEIDKDFARDEIADWLWSDFNIKMSVVVSQENEPLVTAYESELRPAEEGKVAIAAQMDLIEQARGLYQRFIRRQTVPVSVFKGEHDPVRGNEKLYTWSIRKLNDQLAYVTAQVIVPSEPGYALDAHPKVFLSYKMIGQDMYDSIREQLDLTDFRYTVDARVQRGDGVVPIALLGNGSVVHARWTSGKPSREIWKQTLPTLAMPFVATLVILLLIAWRFMAVVRALQASEEKNRNLATHDALTGLPNRLMFNRTLEAIIAQGRRDRCAILALDLDRFKAVNDSFGHQAGDVVLTVVSERIQQDIGEHGMAARVGGDEFVILLWDCLEKHEVMQLAERLLEDISKTILIPGGIAEVGASIGIAWWPDDAASVKAIMRCADEALYLSKGEGRGRITCASLNRRAEDVEGDDPVKALTALLSKVS